MQNDGEASLSISLAGHDHLVKMLRSLCHTVYYHYKCKFGLLLHFKALYGISIEVKETRSVTMNIFRKKKFFLNHL